MKFEWKLYIEFTSVHIIYIYEMYI